MLLIDRWLHKFTINVEKKTLRRYTADFKFAIDALRDDYWASEKDPHYKPSSTDVVGRQ